MEETEKIARRLEKMLKSGNIDEESALKYLKRLRGVEMTLDILTKTGVGIIINKIRKESGNSEIATLGKNIIKQWKKLVPDKVEPSTPNAGMKRSPDTSNGVTSDDGGPSDTKHSRVEKTEPVEPAPVPVSRGYFPVHTMTTTDQFRLKAREMIQSALECGNIPSGAYESEFLAIRIESAIYDIFNNTDSKYKQRVRTRVMNLRDSNNPNLRLNVLMGHVNPDKLASMTSEEMASKEMKELREKYTKETIEDHQMAVTGGTETDLLKCGKCKQNKCTYNQVQTRSADEPMTTFVFCNHCGHRWKFC
ncbi:Transcription elongation factor A protein 1 [Clonorchis sinensis]|uniref:Transcription elongation factor n=1 Tax=Clonorchis sinensis TaxID=79923 RepID=A0A8T1M1E2_CLOSI|nr:Transcription elongation factor A protein 1 [Clonorchis sinensis]